MRKPNLTLLKNPGYHHESAQPETHIEPEYIAGPIDDYEPTGDGTLRDGEGKLISAVEYHAALKKKERERTKAFAAEDKILWDRLGAKDSKRIMITGINTITGEVKTLTEDDAIDRGYTDFSSQVAGVQVDVKIPNPKDPSNPRRARLYNFLMDRVPKGMANIWIQEFQSDGRRADMYGLYYKTDEIVHAVMSEDGARAVVVGKLEDSEAIRGFASKFVPAEVDAPRFRN